MVRRSSTRLFCSDLEEEAAAQEDNGEEGNEEEEGGVGLLFLAAWVLLQVVSKKDLVAAVKKAYEDWSLEVLSSLSPSS
jgi:hypothetical protein